MEIIFILIILAAFVLLVIVLLGSRLPKTWTIEKAVLVQAMPSRIFPYLDTLENWEKWTVWGSASGVDLQFSYEGSRLGVGAVQQWKSRQFNGTLTLTKSQLDREVQYSFELDNGILMNGTIVIASSDGEHTQVAWRLQMAEIQSINPVQRYLGYFLQKFFEAGLDESLNNLQALFESQENS